MDMDKRDENLHKLLGRLIRENGTEQAPDGFTEKVLLRIYPEIQQSGINKYRPLISRPGWLLITIMVGFLLAGLISGFFPMELKILETINLERLHLESLIPEKGTIATSSPLVYGAIALAVFVYLQIALIKRYLDPRQLSA
jgi:hypothetical protein